MKNKIKLMMALILAATQLIACGGDDGNYYGTLQIEEAEEQLEACPWCGSTDVGFCAGLNSNQPIVGCNDCYAKGPNCDTETWTLEDAVEKWNSLSREETSDELNDDLEEEECGSHNVEIPTVGSKVSEESILYGGFIDTCYPTEIESCQVETDINGKKYLTYTENGEESEKYYLADDFHFYLEFFDYSCPTTGSQYTAEYQEVSLNSGLKIWESNLTFGGEHSHTEFYWLAKDNDLADEIFWDQFTMEPTYYDVDYQYLSRITLVYRLNLK